MGPSSKSTCCSVCNKTFSRSDHLKRHQLRHSGLKPYCCVFCRQPFTRSDLLKAHYRDCPQRGDRTIPEPARQGRRSHACDPCTGAKLGCDGNSPCTRCSTKGIECSFARLQPLTPAIGFPEHTPYQLVNDGQIAERHEKITPARTTSHTDSLSDRGSIKFLLNSGTASFIECFRFPSSWERKNLDGLRSSVNDSGDGPPGVDQLGSYKSEDHEEYAIDWSVFDDESFFRFFSSPFGEGDLPLQGLFATLQDDMSTQQRMSASPTAISQPEIIRALLDAAFTLNLSTDESAEISRHLNFLYTPERTEKFCNMYFEFWHPHCPIIHRPSFRMDTIPTALLVPITLMGAMYSTVDKEVSTAKLLLDLAEIFVFSVDDLREEIEIQRMLRLPSTMQQDPNLMMGPLAFDHVRAAHLMVCVQYWAGNTLAKRRVVETRFGVAVKVARRIGLTKTRHEHPESGDEFNWIQTETRVRTISIMVLLDCAFTFFANFPCRFALSELGFELPCDERFFNNAKPFTKSGFTTSRGHTIQLAFQSLFEQRAPQQSLGLANTEATLGPLDLNCMDMFILIHLLYVCAHTHVTMFSQAPRIDGRTSGEVTPTTNSNRARIESALARWRTLWAAIRARISNAQWSELGFITNGYHYWLVTQLLISHPGSSDLLRGMQVNCEDTLKHIRKLLRDPWD
jgi:hypothetical protein